MHDTARQLTDILSALKAIDQDPESLNLDRLQEIEAQTVTLKEVFESLTQEEQGQHLTVINEIITLTESLLFQTQTMEADELASLNTLKRQKKAGQAYGKMQLNTPRR